MDAKPYPQVDLKNRWLAGFLAWVCPGLGHFYQGRLSKAIVFFFIINSLFWFGFWLGGWRSVYFRWNEKEWRWPYVAQAGMGLVTVPAWFPPGPTRAWLPAPLATFQAAPLSDRQFEDLCRRYDIDSDVRELEAKLEEEAHKNDRAPAFFDRNLARTRLLREQHGIGVVTEAELDNLHNLGKIIELALVYTMVAGLLNFLVIYDAIAGPAMLEEERRMYEEGPTAHRYFGLTKSASTQQASPSPPLA